MKLFDYLKIRYWVWKVERNFAKVEKMMDKINRLKVDNKLLLAKIEERIERIKSEEL